MDLSKDLIENNLDARVAAGDKALELALSRIRKTIALLEPMVEKLKAKPKPRSVHTIEPMDEFPRPTQVWAEVRTKKWTRLTVSTAP